MNLGLTNKTIIVAGGLGGIGIETVKTLRMEGAKVIILTQDLSGNSINKPSKLYEIIKTSYSDKLLLKNDLLPLFQKQKPDGLITFVGSGRGEKSIFANENETKRIWNINYFYNKNIAEVFVDLMQNLNSEQSNTTKFITFTSSIVSKMYVGCPTEYSSSKAALERLTKDLSWKLAPNFRVNCISPGNIYFEGGTWDKIIKEDKSFVEKILAEKVPLKRFGYANEIADFSVFLSSPKASFFNGACITIDGGQSIAL